MKALTLTQPWATLIAIRAKHIETRSWQTAYRGRLAIHAAKGFPRACHEVCATEPFRSVLKEAGVSHTRELPIGAIVAVVRLADVVPVAYDVPGGGYPSNINSQEMAFGNFEPGRFAWHLDRIIALATPVPCRGALGLWTVPIDVERQVRDTEAA